MSTLLSTTSSQTIDVDDLRELMLSVTDTTRRLEATHSALQKQVATLQQELAEANARVQHTHTQSTLSNVVSDMAVEMKRRLGAVDECLQQMNGQLHNAPEQGNLCRAISGELASIRGMVDRLEAFRAHTPARNATEMKNGSLMSHIGNGHLISQHTNGHAHHGSTSSVSVDGVVCGGELKLDDIERTTILATLQHYRGHRQKSANALGIGVRTLGLKLRKWKDLKIVDESL